MLKNVPSPLIWLVVLLQIAVVPLTVLRRGPGKWRAAFKGVAAGLKGLPRVWRERRKIQSGRVVGSAAIARALVWSPRGALRHAPHVIAPAAEPDD
jgi:N-acetylglucosaminyl-diphospho-decaprenol L-rhamnosyltransferase